MLDRDDPPIGQMGRNDVAIDALGLFCEPLDERSPVQHLASRLGQRLALLGRHDGSQIVLVGKHQIVPAAQDRGAFFRGP